jgi:hypothetical protein
MVVKPRNLLIVVAVGVGLLGALSMFSGSERASLAQPAATIRAPAELEGTGRYQVSAWGNGQFVDGNMKVAYGAYIIDSKTGDLYFSQNDSAPRLIGSLKKK